MLRPRFAAAKVRVVREIHQYVRALLCELADQVRKCGFVTDEHSETAARGRQHFDLVAGYKIAGLLRHTIDEPKYRRDEFAERNELDLVVTARFLPLRTEQDGGIQWLSGTGKRDGSEQKIAVAARHFGGRFVKDRIVVKIERRGKFGPDHQRRGQGV